ncbi:MAG TPA: potassium-transporting ATPase subunit C [Blastocatellia bacterium]|nr:potassium-transporting ATPase subunit C [Blastocatellia bacterium]
MKNPVMFVVEVCCVFTILLLIRSIAQGSANIGFEFQIPRVARERNTSEEKIRQLVQAHTEGRQFGFLGEPRVNVLELNLDLDRVLKLEESR